MALLRGRSLLRYLLTASMLGLLVFLSSLWLPQLGRDCESSWHPCLTFHLQTPTVAIGYKQSDGQPEEEEKTAESSSSDLPLPPECPGQSFQAHRLLRHLSAALGSDDDVMMEPYLDSWEELIKFMESLGTIVSFFSQKVRDKVLVIRELSLKHSTLKLQPPSPHELQNPAPHELQNPAPHELQNPAPHELQNPAPSELQPGAYHSVRSMVEAELKAGAVDFSRRNQSGCRTLLRLHRSLQWLRLLLQGLMEGRDQLGMLRTPGDLCREAYLVALAPHHPWLIRQMAEVVFISLPDRRVFLDVVCVSDQEQFVPVLHALTRALRRVHVRTQRVLEAHGLLELP